MDIIQQIFHGDIERLYATEWIPWEEFERKTFFITGATGLIGSNFVSALQYYNAKNSAGIRLLLLVRDAKRAVSFFEKTVMGTQNLQFVEGSVENIPCISEDIDYIVHCACPTESAYFVSNPVETIQSILTGTMNVLELAKGKQIKGMVYLSSMEVYGQIKDRETLNEENVGYLDPLVVRNCYPQGKRMAETLCVSYADEYGVPVRIARLAQSFGPGVKMQDKRVFAYMARCVMNNENIVLNTDGSKENMYVYTMDAVSAILLLLTRGENAKAYNVSNEKTYCSIKEMGERLIAATGKTCLSVVVNHNKNSSSIYRPDGYLKLSSARLRSLGWVPFVDLDEMYAQMISTFST